MRAAATIVAKSNLPLARVLASSFAQYHPDIVFFVLLCDEVEECFAPEQEASRLIELNALQIPGLARFRFRHARQELTFAATPYLLA